MEQDNLFHPRLDAAVTLELWVMYHLNKQGVFHSVPSYASIMTEVGPAHTHPTMPSGAHRKKRPSLTRAGL